MESSPPVSRNDGRAATELRPVSFVPGANPYAEGSCEVSFGRTRVLCTASVEKETPKWMGQANSELGGVPPVLRGWITAEYGMLPRSTHTRNKREAASGKQGGRTMEIQRLIGRALRRAISLEAIPGLTIKIDCDVICADGGTRTAAISGSWVALYQSLLWATRSGLIPDLPKFSNIAAISVGVHRGTPLLDLNYDEDSSADFDLNLVANERGEIIEIQGTGEGGELPLDQLVLLIELARQGTNQLIGLQRATVSKL